MGHRRSRAARTARSPRCAQPQISKGRNNNARGRKDGLARARDEWECADSAGRFLGQPQHHGADNSGRNLRRVVRLHGRKADRRRGGGERMRDNAAESRTCARLVPEVVRRARKARRQSDIRACAQKSEFQLEARAHGQAHDARKAAVISFGAGDEERKK